MRKKFGDNKHIVILNIAIPVIAGMVTYLLFSPSVLFIKAAESLTGFCIHKGSILDIPPFIQLIQYYLPDILWGYSLIFALFLVLGREQSLIFTVFIMAVLFSVVMECIQLIPVIPGTFDLLDITAEISAESLAFYILTAKDRKGEYL